MSTGSWSTCSRSAPYLRSSLRARTANSSLFSFRSIALLRVSAGCGLQKHSCSSTYLCASTIVAHRTSSLKGSGNCIPHSPIVLMMSREHEGALGSTKLPPPSEGTGWWWSKCHRDWGCLGKSTVATRSCSESLVQKVSALRWWSVARSSILENPSRRRYSARRAAETTPSRSA